jgi:SAM-dependent methyltransferase
MAENLMDKYFGDKFYGYDLVATVEELNKEIYIAEENKILYVSVPCTVCWDTLVFPLYKQPKSRNLLSTGYVGQCYHCGNIYTNVRFSDHITTCWYRRFLPGFLVNDKIRKVDWIRRPLLNNYELDLIESYTDVGNMLDIGACGGDLLVYARERGWVVAGQDLSELSIYVLRQLDIPAVLGHVYKTRYQEASFSVITMRHTLEHFMYPVTELKVLHHVLADDGLLYIVVPKWVDKEDYNYDLPQHLTHFTHHSLDMLLCTTGYEVLLSEDAESSRALVDDKHKGIYNNIRCIARRR